MKVVKVYQIEMDENNLESLDRKFTSWGMLEKMGKTFDKSIYKEVYFGLMDVEDVEEVYGKLQGIKPDGYKGHSLSVSDLVEMDGHLYFCDSFGFVDVTEKS